MEHRLLFQDSVVNLLQGVGKMIVNLFGPFSVSIFCGHMTSYVTTGPIYQMRNSCYETIHH